MEKWILRNIDPFQEPFHSLAHISILYRTSPRSFFWIFKSSINMVLFWPLHYFPIAGQNVHWAADTWSRNCKWRTSALSPVSDASPQTLLVLMSCNSSSRWWMWSFTETLSGTTTFLRSPPPRWLTDRPAPPWMPLRVMDALTIVMTPLPTKVKKNKKHFYFLTGTWKILWWF